MDVGRQAAVSQFLEAISQPAFQETAIVGGGRRPKQLEPTGLELAAEANFRADICAKTPLGIRHSPFRRGRMTALRAKMSSELSLKSW